MDDALARFTRVGNALARAIVAADIAAEAGDQAAAGRAETMRAHADIMLAAGEANDDQIAAWCDEAVRRWPNLGA
jgi:hypothetical protein